MTTTRTTSTPRYANVIRWGAASLAVITVGSGCSSGEADPAQYFAEFDRAQVELDATMDTLWLSPRALEVEAIADEALSIEPAPDELDPEEEATVRLWMGEFWDLLLDASQAHRDAVDDLAVPDRVETEHAAYVAAFDALLSRRSDLVGRADNYSGVELLASMWEPIPEVSEIDRACVEMKNAAELLDITIAAPLCTD